MSDIPTVAYQDIWYPSADGLQLYARDYGNDSARLNLLCMPGLTRNSADFEPLCELLHPDYRLLAVDLRGRGRSAWDNDPTHYHPAVYVQDIFALMDRLALDKLVLVGTSLGGLMAIIMNALRPGSFAGVILNDIGPVVEQAGLDRIKTYVGKTAPVTTWPEAVASTRMINAQAFPHYQQPDWERAARRIYRENARGVPELLYDPAIAQPMAAGDDNAVPENLWPLFEKLSAVPLLVIRGALSDILSPQTVREMRRRKPDLHAVEVPEVGHAPVLDEPPVVEAITAFLAGLP